MARRITASYALGSAVLFIYRILLLWSQLRVDGCHDSIRTWAGKTTTNPARSPIRTLTVGFGISPNQPHPRAVRLLDKGRGLSPPAQIFTDPEARCSR